jgi:hypothetical protein
MKVLCDCGSECLPSEDEQGNPEFIFPVASFSSMGRRLFELRALWFLCQDEECRKSFLVLPWNEEARVRAVVPDGADEPFKPEHHLRGKK